MTHKTKGIHEIKSGIYKGLTTKEVLDNAWECNSIAQHHILTSWAPDFPTRDIIWDEEIRGQTTDGYWENMPLCKIRILDLLNHRPEEDYHRGMFGRMLLSVRCCPGREDYGIGNLFRDIRKIAEGYDNDRLGEWPNADDKDCRLNCKQYQESKYKAEQCDAEKLWREEHKETW